MITHVAIKYDNLSYILVKPNRHGDLIKMMAQEFSMKKETMGEQGFYSPDTGFLNRKDALKHVEECGQELIRKTHPKDELFSEDLW